MQHEKQNQFKNHTISGDMRWVAVFACAATFLNLAGIFKSYFKSKQTAEVVEPPPTQK